MTHRFPIKEIARQAGLGTATVDRVLNGRAHVSAQTQGRVATAIAELEGQEAQLAARGRRMFVDVVVEAPERFSRQVRVACEAVLPEVREAVFRPRFLFQEMMSVREVVAALERVRRRGSQGVILKARDVPAVRDAVDALVAARIPVVTLVTDVPESARLGYVGLDNAQAGQVAAYLLAGADVVLASRSQEDFQGEAERFEGFRAAFRGRIVEVAGGAGLAGETRRQLTDVPRVDGVYSMGGGNGAILDVLGGHPVRFVAHDLDMENRRLLAAERINFVLHHDLEVDLKRAFRAISACHGLGPAGPVRQFSDVQVVTPFNVPG